MNTWLAVWGTQVASRTLGELIDAAVPTCLSFQGWRPLCGRQVPNSINPDRTQVTCRDCLYMMGQTIYEDPV